MATERTRTTVPRHSGPQAVPEWETLSTGTIAWRAFAGFMLGLAGLFNLIDGLVALITPNYYVNVTGRYDLVITTDLHAWGWFAIGIAALMIAASASILLMTGAMWSRVVGIVVAGINMIFQLAFLAAFPLWSVIMILFDVLVVYALTVHGGREAA